MVTLPVTAMKIQSPRTVAVICKQISRPNSRLLYLDHRFSATEDRILYVGSMWRDMRLRLGWNALGRRLRPHPIDERQAVEMINLMLDDPAQDSSRP